MQEVQLIKDRQEIQVAMKLDAKGLNCPLPILKTKVVLNKMRPGEILFVEATDPHAEIDFEAYCARSRHELIRVSQAGDVYEFYIRRAEHPDHT
ncbi:MAG TPA: sulfurtransferase TusA family protein [Gammaproteobacteria bacterium]